MQLEAVMQIVNSIYESAFDNHDWDEVLIRIADTAGAANSALVSVDTQLNSSLVRTPRADPSVVDAYANHWWSKDVTAVATGSKPVGLITTLEDTGRDLFFGSEFYNDYWRTSGLGAERAAANLFVDDGAFISFVLQAKPEDDSLDGDAIRLLEFVVPHLVRSAELQRQMRLMEYGERLAESGKAFPGFGVILVDPACRVIAADEEAKAIEAQRNDIRFAGGLIELSSAAETTRLQRLVRWVEGYQRGGEMCLAGAAGFQDLGVQVMPYRHVSQSAEHLIPSSPHAIVLLRDDTRKIAAWIADLHRTYALTEAEGRVAIEIARGGGSGAVSGRLSIALSTVRTHLSRIFEKTGVKRQAELVALLARRGIAP